jgi:hypothetical protein
MAQYILGIKSKNSHANSPGCNSNYHNPLYGAPWKQCQERKKETNQQKRMVALKPPSRRIPVAVVIETQNSAQEID